MDLCCTLWIVEGNLRGTILIKLSKSSARSTPNTFWPSLWLGIFLHQKPIILSQWHLFSLPCSSSIIWQAPVAPHISLLPLSPHHQHTPPLYWPPPVLIFIDFHRAADSTLLNSSPLCIWRELVLSDSWGRACCPWRPSSGADGHTRSRQWLASELRQMFRVICCRRCLRVDGSQLRSKKLFADWMKNQFLQQQKRTSSLGVQAEVHTMWSILDTQVHIFCWRQWRNCWRERRPSCCPQWKAFEMAVHLKLQQHICFHLKRKRDKNNTSFWHLRFYYWWL